MDGIRGGNPRKVGGGVRSPDGAISTAPYASIPHLTGALQANGHEVLACDASLEILLRILDRGRLEEWWDTADKVRSQIEARPELDASERRELRRLQHLLVLPRSIFREVEDSVVTMRERSRFRKPELFNRAFDVVRACSYFAFSVSPNSYSESRRIGHAILEEPSPTPLPNPPQEFIGQLVDEILAEGPEAIGITTPFDGSVFFGLKFAREIKRHRPDLPVLMGGAGIDGGSYRVISDPFYFQVLDYVMVGDGDVQLPRLLHVLEQGGDPSQIKNLRWLGKDGRVARTELELVNDLNRVAAPDFTPMLQNIFPNRDLLACLANRSRCSDEPLEVTSGDVWPKSTLLVPDGQTAPLVASRGRLTGRGFATLGFSKLPLERYLLPDPVATFQTSRGCYYGRRTFCSELFRKGFRVRRPELVVEDMVRIFEQSGIRHFQLWDSLAPPKTLKRIALEIKRRGLPFEWMAETKFEKPYRNESMVRTLAEGGCTFLQFGFESASSRVLDGIDKGNRIEDVEAILALLEQHGIRAGMPWFIGFPGESEREADLTYDFSAIRRDQVMLSSYTRVFRIGKDTTVFLEQKRFGIEIFEGDGGVLDYVYTDGRERWSTDERDQACGMCPGNCSNQCA